jgi:hypothetical protein
MVSVLFDAPTGANVAFDDLVVVSGLRVAHIRQRNLLENIVNANGDEPGHYAMAGSDRRARRVFAAPINRAICQTSQTTSSPRTTWLIVSTTGSKWPIAAPGFHPRASSVGRIDNHRDSARLPGRRRPR